MVLLLTDFNDQQKIDRYLYLLNLLDFIMDNSTLVLHTQIASKNFMSSLLRLLKLNERPEIQRKTLVLIEKWGIRFEKQKDILPNFSESNLFRRLINVLQAFQLTFSTGKSSPLKHEGFCSITAVHKA